jgi:hypothetical protein
MKTEDNPSVFPWANDANKDYNWINRGMTLRDYFAAKVMQTMVATDIEPSPERAPIIAESAYILADAMLRARAR